MFLPSTTEAVPTPEPVKKLDRWLRILEIACVTTYATTQVLPGWGATRTLEAVLAVTAWVWGVMSAVAAWTGRVDPARLGSQVPDLFLYGFFVLAGPNVELSILALLGRRFVAWIRASRRGPVVTGGVKISPSRAIFVSFALLIVAGTLVLTMPYCYSGSRNVGLVDSLFMATSAVCVTGLSVLDVDTALSPFGQWVLLGLVQVGGLGVMTLSTFIALAGRRRLSGGQQGLARGIVGADDLMHLRQLTVTIVMTTLALEAAGAVVLGFSFRDSASGPVEALRLGVFHAVSAFCNAGFALFPDSLTRFRGSPAVLLTIAGLIIVGGLGFSTVSEILLTAKRGLHPKRSGASRGRLSPTACLVLAWTLALLTAGSLAYFFIEHNRTFSDMTLGERILNGFFCATTARTAGFNTVDYGEMSGAGLLLTVFLMFVGGGPGGTAGGIRVTTLAIAVMTLRTLVGHQSRITTYGRKVPVDVILRSLALIVAASSALLVGAAVLTMVEPFPLHVLVFEAASALGTVGLSTGVTSKLTVVGKLVLVVLMFVGRIGTSTVVILWIRDDGPGDLWYPEERFPVG